MAITGDTGRLSLLLSSEELAFDPALSPDGKMIAYAAGDGTSVDLFVRMVQGGQPVQVTDDNALEATPAFSPDGERIAFTRRDSTGSDQTIWVVPALGGDATPVASNWKESPHLPPGPVYPRFPLFVMESLALPASRVPTAISVPSL